MDFDTARNFLIALLIGALVGIEREKKKDTESGHAFGGLRTFTLIALVGAAAGWLARTLDAPWLVAVALATVGAAVVASHLLQARDADASHGLTSEVAAMAVCLLGAMAVLGDPGLAVALAVATSALLAFKQPLHGLVRHIGSDDLFAGIKLLIASFIVLPLLPNAALDPWGALNPYTLWLLVILISALSLLGYVAVRALGTTYGTAITGLAGGLVSSTATTASLAATSRVVDADDPAQADALAAGILLSWLVMFVRVGVLVAMLNRALLAPLLPALGGMGAVCAALALWHSRRAQANAATRTGSPLALANPFSLSAAIQFGALFALVMLAVRLAQLHAPGIGVYLVAVLAGLVDVDAITLSVASAADNPGAQALPAVAITLAVLSNTVVKCAIVWWQGRGALRGQILRAGLALMVVGLALSAWA